MAAYRSGETVSQIVSAFNVSKPTVHRWLNFAKGKRLDRVNFHNKKTGTEKPNNKSTNKTERQVIAVRKFLKKRSVLGLYGADSIRKEMIQRGYTSVPTTRTIARIVKRNGLVDFRKRVRRKAPPAGWYLTDLCKRQVELDSFDIVESLYLKGGTEVQLLNGISLHGSLAHSKPMSVVTTENTVLAVIEHWKTFGIPRYAQFDNDMVFQGNRKQNAIGKVIRLCLSLGVTPVFATPYEQGFQGKIERFNGEVQQKCWRRKHFKNFRDVERRVDEWILAHRLEHQSKIVSAPCRRPFPKKWKRDDEKQLHGTIIYLRRTDGAGYVTLLENEFLVSENWINRLVRAEVNLDKGVVRFYALRRAEHAKHRLLKKTKFKLTRKLDGD